MKPQLLHPKQLKPQVKQEEELSQPEVSIVKIQKKKRKPEDFVEKATIDRKFKSKVSPPTKDKIPFDLDKQCGVPLETGVACTRSITCKIHSVSLKRAVVGRTMPYDSLIQQYQARAAVKKKSKPIEQPTTTEHDISQFMQALKSFTPTAVIQKTSSFLTIKDWWRLKERIALKEALEHIK